MVCGETHKCDPDELPQSLLSALAGCIVLSRLVLRLLALPEITTLHVSRVMLLSLPELMTLHVSRAMLLSLPELMTLHVSRAMLLSLPELMTLHVRRAMLLTLPEILTLSERSFAECLALSVPWTNDYKHLMWAMALTLPLHRRSGLQTTGSHIPGANF